MKKWKIKEKIESFLKQNGAKPWDVLPTHLVAPNGHKFCVECSGDVFAIFHRDSIWGCKQNFFEWNSCPELEQKAMDFIKEKIK